MKILHISGGKLFGGIETYLVTLARYKSVCPDMEPHFALCFPGRLRNELATFDVPIHDLSQIRLSRPWTVLRARWELKRLLKEQRIEAVITHGMWSHLIFAKICRAANVKLASISHDYLDQGSWINRWASKTKPNVLLANSGYTSTRASELFGQPCEVLRYPVAPSTIDKHTARQEIRKELSTDPNMVVILQASRLEEWKGQHIHIEALGKLKDIPNWEAWFAGGPQKAGEVEYSNQLKARVASLGLEDRVKFLGQRSDVPRLMAGADIFCQPNAGPEPFGIVFIEALYAGLPVASSAFGGAKEIVTADCGLLSLPNDPESLSANLKSLITDQQKRQTMGEAGKKRAKELCDPHSQINLLWKKVSTDN